MSSFSTHISSHHTEIRTQEDPSQKLCPRVFTGFYSLPRQSTTFATKPHNQWNSKTDVARLPSTKPPQNICLCQKLRQNRGAKRCQCNEHPQPPGTAAGTKKSPIKTKNHKMLPSTTNNNAPITKHPPRPETHKLHASKRDKIWNPELAQSTRTNRGAKKPMRGEITDRMGRIVGKQAVAGRGAVPRRCLLVYLTRVMLGCVLAWMHGGPSMPHGIICLIYVYAPIHPSIRTYIHTYMCPQPTWCGHLIS